MSRSWERRGRNYDRRRNSASGRQVKTLVVVFALVLTGLFVYNNLNSFTKLFGRFGKTGDQLAILNLKTASDGKSRINFVTNTKPVVVGTFEPVDKKLSAIAIDEATFTFVPGGFGWYQLGSVYKLGQLENPPKGGLLLKAAGEQLLLVPIDYYIDFKDNLNEMNFSILKSKVSQVSSLIAPFWLITHPNYLKNNVDTNITQKDAYLLFWKLRGVRFTEDDFYDLSRDYLDEVLLPDNSKGYMLKNGSADDFVADIFGDPQIKQEDVAVAIVNSTKVSGLASNASRMLEHIGINVVRVDNAETVMETTIIRVSQEFKDTNTVKKLEKIFQTTAVIDNNLKSEDVIVTLGDDFGL